MDALEALPCSLFFSLKTHSALPRHPPPGQTAEGLPQGLQGTPPFSGPFAPLAFFFLCKGLGGTGQGSASEHFMSLRGKPHDAAGTRGARPFGSSRARRARAPPAGGRQPLGSKGPRCQSVSVFLHLLYKSVSRGRTVGRCSDVKAAPAAGLWVLLFDQNIPSLLVTAMCSFHSFCRLLGPCVLRALIHI